MFHYAEELACCVIEMQKYPLIICMVKTLPTISLPAKFESKTSQNSSYVDSIYQKLFYKKFLSKVTF